MWDIKRILIILFKFYIFKYIQLNIWYYDLKFKYINFNKYIIYEKCNLPKLNNLKIYLYLKSLKFLQNNT